MSGIVSWMKTIIYFLLLLSVVDHLPIGGSCRNYIRIFGGFILILLVVGPVMKVFDSDGRFDYFLDTERLLAGNYDYSAQITEGDTLREEALLKEYQEAIRMQTKELLERKGYETITVKVQADMEPESANYGRLTEMYVELIPKASSGQNQSTVPDAAEADNDSVKSRPGEADIVRITITPVEILPIDIDPDTVQKLSVSSAEEIALRQYLAEYYGAEENVVTVRIIW